MSYKLKLLDTVVDFHDPIGNDGQLVIKREQEIPADWVSDLKRDKIDADHQKMGEFVRVAAIPTIFYEELLREGRDIEQMSLKELVNLLKARGLDAFLTTNKTF
jgi:hypothetical protein